MIEEGFMSAGGGGEPMDGEPGPGISFETTLGSATGVMGDAGAAGITTGEGDAGFG